MSDRDTVEGILSEIKEMLARVEERQIAQTGRVDQLEEDVRGLSRQVNVAHGGILVVGVLGGVVAIVKAILSS
jgi:hypothetical protein